MTHLSKPAVRRAVYFGAAFVLAILVAAGLITDAQFTSWTQLVEQALPLIGSGALLFAGAKTHEGSDDPTTREDVQRAYEAAAPAPPQPLSVAEAEAALAEARAAESAETAPAVDEHEIEVAYKNATWRE